MSSQLSRNAVVALLGTPTRTEGSLNDPRIRSEQGLDFNEKWIYEELLNDPSGCPERVVYWSRYDFVGTIVRGDQNGQWRNDQTLRDALVSSDSRLAPHDGSRNPAVTPTNRYRPVSEFRGKRDLGGYIQPPPEGSSD